jgi:uncharacterized membrane-anchored protein
MNFKTTLLLGLFIFNFFSLKAQDNTGEEMIPEDSAAAAARMIEESLVYQKGEINLMNGLAKITVPEGYKFLDAKQSQYVLHVLWANPEDTSTLGMLFPENSSPMSNLDFAVEIAYSEEGFIDDEDAKDLNYDDLLTEMQKDSKEANPNRKAEGYPQVELVGWATPPFYDDVNKKLHWAKELKFENTTSNTLNYNVRILGRKGFLNMNVIGDMSTLPAVQKDIKKILASAEFKEGNKYSDYNPDIDKVAAYGIGGLIAGKVLAKVGFFAIILKFWKVIGLGAIAVGAGIKKFFFGAKENQA